MLNNSPRTIGRLLLLAVLIATCISSLGVVGAMAQERSERNRNERRRDDDQPAPRWLRRLAGIREPGRHERSHTTVRTAFTDVVGSPARSTVKVLVDDEIAALGTIVDGRGYVLTKYSELDGDVECELRDGRRLDAQIVGADHDYDLAMLKVEADGLPPVEWAESAPKVGGWVVTVGFDEKPAAIGVVSVAPRHVRAPSGILGVGVDRAQDKPRIKDVHKGSGADQAGLKVGDEVLYVNGKKIEGPQELIDTLGEYQAGDKVRLQILRGDETLTVNATLGSRRELALGNRFDQQEDLAGPLSDRRSGFPLVLQHDTVLRPRQCGGPLVDLDGKVVGINIARAGRVASYATPASAIQPLLPSLMSGDLAPGLSSEEEQIQLAETVRRLRESITDWREKLLTLTESMATAESEYAAAKQATETDQSAQALVALKKAEKRKADIEQDKSRAQRELDQAVAELRKHETQRVSVDD